MITKPSVCNFGCVHASLVEDSDGPFLLLGTHAVTGEAIERELDATSDTWQSLGFKVLLQYTEPFYEDSNYDWRQHVRKKYLENTTKIQSISRSCRGPVPRASRISSRLARRAWNTSPRCRVVALV